MIRIGAIRNTKRTRKTPSSTTLSLVECHNGTTYVHDVKVYRSELVPHALRTLAHRLSGPRPLTIITNEPAAFDALAGVSVIEADVDAQARKATRKRLKAGSIVAAGRMSRGELEAKTEKNGTFFEALALAALEFETEEDLTMSGNINLNVVRPMRTVTAAKDKRPRAVIGTAVAAGSLAAYGVEFGPSKIAALAAVEPFTDAQGRRAYCVVATATCPASQLRETEKALRRELARADNPPKQEPERPTPVKISQAPDSHAQIIERRTETRQAKARAAKAELARLDRLGQGYVCKNDSEPDLQRLSLLLSSGRLVASSRETRGILHEIRGAIDTNAVYFGPSAVALARAIQAAG